MNRYGPRPPSPWTADDLLRTIGTVAAGLVASVVAWRLSLGEDHLEDQVRWANLSLGGFIVGSYGMALWLLRGRRAVGRRRIAMLGEPRHRSVAAGPHSVALVAGARLAHYHRADCPLARGRGWPVRPAAAHRAAGHTPCRACSPDE